MHVHTVQEWKRWPDLKKIVTETFGFDPFSVCFSLFLWELLGSSHSPKTCRSSEVKHEIYCLCVSRTKSPDLITVAGYSHGDLFRLRLTPEWCPWWRFLTRAAAGGKPWEWGQLGAPAGKDTTLDLNIRKNKYYATADEFIVSCKSHQFLRINPSSDTNFSLNL